MMDEIPSNPRTFVTKKRAFIAYENRKSNTIAMHGTINPMNYTNMLHLFNRMRNGVRSM